MARFSNPVPQFLDENGDPVPGGSLTFFSVGTTTKKAVYSDPNFTNQTENPVVLDSEGRVPDFFIDGAYKVTFRRSDGTLVWERDNVAGDETTGAFEEWNSQFIYDDGDFVRGTDGNYYVSLTDNNIGSDPTSQPSSSWTQVRVIRVWNSLETYVQDSIVQASDGGLYVSLNNSNLGNDPTTDAAGNWKPALPGVAQASVALYALNNL